MYGIAEDKTRTMKLAQPTMQVVQELEFERSEDVICNRFSSLLEEFGFNSVACISMPIAGDFTPDSLLMNTRPSIWVEEYLTNGFLAKDPILQYLQNTPPSYSWSDALAAKGLTTAQKRVMQHSYDYGITEGFVVPIYEASGNMGLVSMAGTGSAGLDADNRCLLTLASVFLYNKLAACRRQRRASDIRLTEREGEILKWIAVGKSDWQIGKILNISQKTVNYHVENVKRKYGVASRVQAVVSALCEGSLAAVR